MVWLGSVWLQLDECVWWDSVSLWACFYVWDLFFQVMCPTMLTTLSSLSLWVHEFRVHRWSRNLQKKISLWVCDTCWLWMINWCAKLPKINCSCILLYKCHLWTCSLMQSLNPSIELVTAALMLFLKRFCAWIWWVALMRSMKLIEASKLAQPMKWNEVQLGFINRIFQCGLARAQVEGCISQSWMWRLGMESYWTASSLMGKTCLFHMRRHVSFKLGEKRRGEWLWWDQSN